MNKLPKVTVCIPVYNCANIIRNCLDSLINQSYENYEVVVLDNKSNDNLKEVVKVYTEKDNRFKYFRYEDHVSAEKNHNRCIEHVDSKYFSVFHADDIYHCDILKDEVNALEKNKNCGCVFTLSRHINEDGKFNRYQFIPNELKGLDVAVLDRKSVAELSIKYGNIFHCPSVMFRTKIYRGEGYFTNDEKYNKVADFALWLEISKKYNLAIVMRYRTDYRIGSFGFSDNFAKENTNESRVISLLNELMVSEKLYDFHHFLKIQKLKDASDITLNRRKLGMTEGVYKVLYMSIVLLLSRASGMTAYHYKIIIWGLVVGVFGNKYSTNNVINLLHKMRHYKK